MITNYRNLAYTSPETGTRLEFPFDGELNDSVIHNLGSFQFAGQDGIFHQDNSLNTGDYTFVLLIDNQDFLKEIRDAFNEKKTEDSVGELEHPDPSLGTFPVVISSINYGQNTTKKSGIAKITVTFLKDIPNLLGGDPLSSSASATASAIDELNIEQANDFANSVDLSTGAGFASLVNSAVSAVNTATERLSSIAGAVDEVAILFSTTAGNILDDIDTLARAPFDLARQMQNLIQLPMLAVDQATLRLSAYQEYVNDVLGFSETDENEFKSGSPSGKNILSVAGLSSLAGISAINYSAVSTESITISEIQSGETEVTGGYLSRPQIIETIQAVLSSALNTTEILGDRASIFGASTFFTQYFDYSILNKTIVSNTVKNLNERIFNSAREVVFIAEETLSIIGWCAKLYNSVELATLDFFKDTNGIYGDNIFMVDKGREVVYYV
jgi:hypothetical protein